MVSLLPTGEINNVSLTDASVGLYCSVNSMFPPL